MATKNFVPRANNEGGIGTLLKRWYYAFFTDVNISGSITDGTKTTTVADVKNHLDSTLNPHTVTKTQVGLSNVPNVDTTNASNISSGTLPTSVLPSLAISDTYTAANQTAQLALTVQKGDVCVRSDLNESYINSTGNNTAMSDWVKLLTPTDAVTSVAGKVGVVTLDTSDVSENASSLYYTEARVSANTDVAANKSKLAGIEALAQVNLFELDTNLDVTPKA